MNLTPPALSMEESIAQLVERFGFFSDWKDRYQYLIDLGKKLPPLDPADQQEAHRVAGCQSQVWIKVQQQDGRLYFTAGADASIAAGMIALLLAVYNGRTPQEILDTPPAFLGSIGLLQHLSPSRSNGLYHMIKHLQTLARSSQATGN